ncbi:MAG TPA: BrnT family toxin [Candidatus Polarisedimenticolia bacterium]|nr:BrnT family toxin [Candidatus Polarisedimenticolia bacterium]
MSLRFEWDESKDRENQRKHGVSFAEAMTVFSDEHALFQADTEHSHHEDRFLLLGLSASLVVCHCYRTRADVIRIISARRATRRERSTYNRRWKP